MNAHMAYLGLPDPIFEAIAEAAKACFGEAVSRRIPMMEGPWVTFEPESEALPYGFTWDFRAEDHPSDGKWLMQLVTLFRDGYMDNVVMLNGNRVPTHYDMRSGDERRILKILLDDNYFHVVAGTDYPKLSDEDRFLVDLWVPEALLQKIRENVK